MTDKRFKIVDDYLVCYDGDCFDLHKPSDIRSLITTIGYVTDENEQLKSSDTITDLETEIMNLKTTIHQLRTDNTKQKKKLNTTMKENEHIKQTIKDMINTERTEIGKMTLRQLWRQIQ